MGLTINQFMSPSNHYAANEEIKSAMEAAGITNLLTIQDCTWGFTNSYHLLSAFKSESYKDDLVNLLKHGYNERVQLLSRTDAFDANDGDSSEVKLGNLDSL